MIEKTGTNPAALLTTLSKKDTRARLQQRARALSTIRNYFFEQDVLEVETPLLSRCPVSDPYLDNLKVENHLAASVANEQPWLYLQTSPEYGMKQWLAQGSGSIYQLCKAFRQDPRGRLHQPEFSILEWYREGFSLEQLMFDVAALVNRVIPERPISMLSYRDAFLQYLDLDAFCCSDEALAKRAKETIDVSFDSASRDVWLDLLLTHKVEPHLGRDRLTFLYHYPPSQAALAKVVCDSDENSVANRFELYIEGVEIANGYEELTDYTEFCQRFNQDNKNRIAMKKPEVVMDNDFARAMESGIPDCSGVALGIDRLLLFLTAEH